MISLNSFVHQHILLENEAESVRSTMVNAVQHIKNFMEEVTDWGKKLGLVIQQVEGGFQVVQDPEGNQRTLPVSCATF